LSAGVFWIGKDFLTKISLRPDPFSSYRCQTRPNVDFQAHFTSKIRFGRIMIHHQAAFSAKSTDGRLPPAKSSFITAWSRPNNILTALNKKL
jgi:hypothetical protein